jgi:hypothetical protein
MATAPAFDGTQSCLKAGVDRDVFFPDYAILNKSEYDDALNEAKSICNSCNFVVPCLKYALDNNVLGVWGATDERERKAMRKKMRLANPRPISKDINESLRK